MRKGRPQACSRSANHRKFQSTPFPCGKGGRPDADAGEVQNSFQSTPFPCGKGGSLSPDSISIIILVSIHALPMRKGRLRFAQNGAQSFLQGLISRTADELYQNMGEGFVRRERNHRVQEVSQTPANLPGKITPMGVRAVRQMMRGASKSTGTFVPRYSISTSLSR